MSIELRTGFIGLVTNTADLQAPPGSLTVAKNLTARRTGALETRPGIRIEADKGNTLPPLRFIPYEAEAITAGDNNEWWNYNDDQEILYPLPDGTGNISPQIFRRDLIPYAQTRGNLYVGTSVGVLKFDGVPDLVSGNDQFITTGVPVQFSILLGILTTGTLLPTNTQVAYSVVGVKTDANGLVTRSRPTGAYIVKNTGGTVSPAMTITVSIPVAASLAQVDYFEVYRTRVFPLTVTPDQEMQLVFVQANDGGPLLPTFVDNVADNARGQTLYTSPSREGIEGANDRPPSCGALAVFKGALFAGNTVGVWRLIESVNWDPTSSGKTNSATGVGSRRYTGTMAIGSPNITAMSSTVGLQKGMVLTAFGPFPAGTFITNISGTTVTVSQVSGSASTALITFNDAMSFDGGATWHPIVDVTDLGVSGIVVYRITPPVGGFNLTLVIESVMSGAGATPLAVKATHGDEYSPPLPLYDDPAATGDQDVEHNGLHWSKPDEPEHFPPVNFAFVGDKKREILNLVATRDALFIFKEDGIWRLTGIPGQYRIDPFDLTTICVLPGSVVALKNKIYLLANSGICAVSDQGVQVVSMQIADQLDLLAYNLIAGKTSAGFYEINGVTYAGAVSPRDSEYYLIVGDAILSQRSEMANATLVYNEDTSVWTTWEYNSGESDDLAILPATMANWDRFGVTVMCSNRTPYGRVFAVASPDPSVTTFLGQGVPRCDLSLPITITAGTGTKNMTYTPATALKVGDCIYHDTNDLIMVVTAVGSSTTVTVDVNIPFTGPAHAFRPIFCTARPRAFLAPTQVMKQWAYATAQLTTFAGCVAANFYVPSTSLIAGPPIAGKTPADITRNAQGVTAYVAGISLRSWLPTAGARGWRMECEFSWSMAKGAACIEAFMTETVDGKTNTKNLTVAP